MSLVPHHPEARFQSPADLVAHYKRVFKRVDAAGAAFAAGQRIKEAAKAAEAAAREAEKARIAADFAEQVERVAKEERLRALGSSPAHARRIITETAAEFGLEAADIIGTSKTRRVVGARWEAMRRVREACPALSLPRIGRIFGGRDHTTVLHALRKGESNG